MSEEVFNQYSTISALGKSLTLKNVFLLNYYGIIQKFLNYTIVSTQTH